MPVPTLESFTTLTFVLFLPFQSAALGDPLKVTVSTVGLLDKPYSLGSLPMHALYPKLAPLAVRQSVHSLLADSLSHSRQQLLQTSCPLLKPPAPSLPLILRRWPHLLHYWKEWSQMTEAPSASIRPICTQPSQTLPTLRKTCSFTLPRLSSLLVCLIRAPTIMILIITTTAKENVFSSRYGPHPGLSLGKHF